MEGDLCPVWYRKKECPCEIWNECLDGQEEVRVQGITIILRAHTVHELDGTTTVHYHSKTPFDIGVDLIFTESFSIRNGRIMKKTTGQYADGLARPLFPGSKSIKSTWHWWSPLSEKERELYNIQTDQKVNEALRKGFKNIDRFLRGE